MTTTTRANILAAHGLTDMVRVSIPPLRARNHREAVAALSARRAALLEHAEYLTFLASVFADQWDVVAVLADDIAATMANADRCIPGAR